MVNNSQKHRTWLRAGLLRLCRVHFIVFLAYAALVAVFDSAHVLTPDVTVRRAGFVATTMLVTLTVWFMGHKEQSESSFYRRRIYALIAADILFISLSMYFDRGIASREVALYALPIVSAGALVNRSAVFGVAAASAVAYFATGMKYRFSYPNEMYNVELYGMMAFYILFMFALASLVWVVDRARK